MAIESKEKTSVEVTAKKVDDAIKQGLEQLGASLDEVEVEVLESGGLFRKAKVRLTLNRETPSEKPAPKREQPPKEQVSAPQKEQPKTEKTSDKVAPKKEQPKKEQAKPEPKKEQPKKEQAKPEPKKAEKKQDERPSVSSEEHKAALDKSVAFIVEVLQKMGFTEGVTVRANADGDIEIEAPTGDDSLIIGRHGDTLSALSFLAETLNRAEKCHINFTVDCNGYRERRAASLTAMARRRADECVNKQRRIKLEPMERVDRRTIHNALNDDNRVSTASEGKEPHRYVVIYPKKQQKQ